MYVSKLKPCPLWKEKLAATCLDELPRSGRAAFKVHAASCQICDAMLTDYLAVDSRIRQALIPQQSLGLWKAFLTLPPNSNTIDTYQANKKQNPVNNEES